MVFQALRALRTARADPFPRKSGRRPSRAVSYREQGCESPMRPPIFSRNIIRQYRLNSLPAAVFGVMHSAPPLEPFVDAARAADFLSLKPRRVLELARSGELPAYPLGIGKRRVWRFRLSELALAVSAMAL